jgi:excisionase family DNA binding protein
MSDLAQADRYLVPLSDGRWLALDPDTFEAALAEGVAAVKSTASHDERKTRGVTPLYTADEIAALTKIDASWFLARARSNEIAHIRLGKYVRFDFAAVIAHLARGTDMRTADPHSPRIPLNAQAGPGPVSKEVSNSRSDRRWRKRVAASAPETAPCPEAER